MWMEKNLRLIYLPWSMCHMLGNGMYSSCRRYYKVALMLNRTTLSNPFIRILCSNRLWPRVLHQMCTLFVLYHKQLDVYPRRAWLHILPFVQAHNSVVHEAHEHHPNKGASMDKLIISYMCGRHRHRLQMRQLFAPPCWHAPRTLLLGSPRMLLFQIRQIGIHQVELCRAWWDDALPRQLSKAGCAAIILV